MNIYVIATTLKPREPKLVKEVQVVAKLLQFTLVVPRLGESPMITLNWSPPKKNNKCNCQ